MVRILSDDDVASLLEIDALLPVVRDAFVKQERGDVERPDRPHFPVGAGVEGGAPLGTGLVMPAYIHGAPHYATKLVGVHGGNVDRGLPTVNAQIALTDAETGTSRRRHRRNENHERANGLYRRPRSRRTRLVVSGEISRHRSGDASPLASALYRNRDGRRIDSGLFAERFQARVCRRARIGTRRADHAGRIGGRRRGGFDGRRHRDDRDYSRLFRRALRPGTSVIAIGAYNEDMRELDRETFSRADKTVADVPEEVAEIGDVRATDLEAEDFVPLGDVFDGAAVRDSDSEIVVVESVGSAVLDAAASEFVFERAAASNVGEEAGL